MPRSILPLSSLAAVVLLTGCMEDMPRPERPRPPRPDEIACTREYAPVCAARRGKRKTFSNACMARAERYTVISSQPCGRDR
jgi:hypothetical protein